MTLLRQTDSGRILARVGRCQSKSDFLSITRRLFAPLVAMLLVMPAVAGAQQDQPVTNTVRVAVLADRGIERCREEWTPLLAYLQREIPGYSFELLPRTHEQFLAESPCSQASFAIVSPTLFVYLEVHEDAQSLVTQISDRGETGEPTPLYSAVFCRSGNTGIRSLADLRGKRIAGIAPTGLGGWLAGAREIKRAGVDPFRQVAERVFLGNQDAVIEAVLSGKADAGVCRADILHNKIKQGVLAADALRVLPCPPPPKAFDQPAFPVSSRPYPDWAVASLPRTPAELRSRVAVALLSLPATDAAAKASRRFGFVPADNYTEIHALLRELRLPPYEDYGKMTLEQAVRRYAVAAIYVACLVLLTIGTLRWLVVLRTRQLSESRERLNATLQSIGDCVIACDSEGRVSNLNLAAEKLTGWATAEATGRPLRDVFRIVNAHTRAEAEDPTQRALRDGLVVGLANHTVLIARDGREYQIADSCAPIRGGRNRIIGAVLVFRDVTEEYARQEAIRMSEQEKALILDNTNEMIAFHDKDRRLIWANCAYLQRAGAIAGSPVSLDSIKGKRCHEIWGLTQFCSQCPVPLAFQTGQSQDVEITDENPEHRSAWPGSWLVRVAPARNASGEIIGAIEVAIDLTSRKREESGQRRIAILESLGTVAGGIAHDFNNLLMGVFGNIELMKIDLPPEHPALASLQAAHQALDSARRLTSRLLTFAKGGNPVLEEVDLRQRICDTVRFHLAGSAVAAQFNIAEDLWPVKADRGQIGEVISNLTINAKEAMPAGGTLYVEARNIPDIRENAAPELRGAYIRLTFRDEGIGIPANLIGKIFEPYFTTKQAGSGLGLSIVHGIVSKHGGHVVVDSVPAAGTTFTVFLPAAGAAGARPARDAVPTARLPPHAGRHVLLMDDEEIVRLATCRMLEQLGHTVETATDGRDAIAKYDAAMRRGKPFDVAIMDLTVPGGMGGKEAVGYVLALDPSARVLVTSGYSSDPVLSECAKHGFAGHLAKPFTLKELAEALQQGMRGCCAE